MLYQFAHRMVAPLARLIWRPVVTGLDNVPGTGPVILASNHLSFIDSVVIPLVAPRPVVFLTKAEYFTGRGVKGRLTAWFFTAIGSIPVERGAFRGARAALDVALGVLADGRAFGIYPEGSRSPDGRLYRGRIGVAWLALTAQVPVVPVALTGTERIQPVGSRLPRPHRVTVRFGAPLDFREHYGAAGSARARRAVTDEVMAAIAELSGQTRAPGYNQAPRAS